MATPMLDRKISGTTKEVVVSISTISDSAPAMTTYMGISDMASALMSVTMPAMPLIKHCLPTTLRSS